jgi:transposase
MGKTELGRLKNEIAAAQSVRPPRYPEEVWRAGASYSESRVKDGVGLAKVAAELGVKPHTLNYWRAKQRPDRVKQNTLRPVTLRAEPTPSATGLVVYGPRGLRIEGVDIKTLGALIRELS